MTMFSMDEIKQKCQEEFIRYTRQYMRKLSCFWIFILFVIGGFFVTKLVFQTKTAKTIKHLVISVPPTMIPSVAIAASVAKTLIVPYWAVTQQQIDTTGYNQIVYFGITTNKD